MHILAVKVGISHIPGNARQCRKIKIKTRFGFLLFTFLLSKIVLSYRMRLESRILINRTPEQVGKFLGDISNITQWDRGVSGAQQTSLNSEPAGVGFEFETLGYGQTEKKQAQQRMAYRISEVAPDRCTVQLTSSTGNARFFKTAKWEFRISLAPNGTWLTCVADFTLRLAYIFLAPVLYVKKDAIQADLASLKKAVEEKTPLQQPV